MVCHYNLSYLFETRHYTLIAPVIIQHVFRTKITTSVAIYARIEPRTVAEGFNYELITACIRVRSNYRVRGDTCRPCFRFRCYSVECVVSNDVVPCTMWRYTCPQKGRTMRHPIPLMIFEKWFRSTDGQPVHLQQGLLSSRYIKSVESTATIEYPTLDVVS